MRFRNCIHLTMDNFSSTFKLLLYRLMTGIVFFSLTYAILSLNLKSIVRSEEANEIFRLAKEFLQALTSGDIAYLQGFREGFVEALKTFGVFVQSRMSAIVWSLIGLAALYLVSRFVNGLAVVALGSIVNDRMQIYAHARFSDAYVRNLGKAALYQLIYVPISFLYAVLSVLITWFLFFYALSFLPLLMTLVLASTALFCLAALKFTLISSWMPAMIVDGMTVGKAFRQSLAAKKGFLARFVTYLVATYLIMMVNGTAVICTLGSGLFLTIPLTYLFLLCIQFVLYYEDCGKEYFVSYHKIAGRDREPSGFED